jgi:hypothetical protein
MVSAATPPPRIEAGHVATLTVLQYINNALFVSLAGICLLRWRRERGRGAAHRRRQAVDRPAQGR